MKMSKMYAVVGAKDGELLSDETRAFTKFEDAFTYADNKLEEYGDNGWEMDFNSADMSFLITDPNNHLRAIYKIIEVQPDIK